MVGCLYLGGVSRLKTLLEKKRLNPNIDLLNADGAKKAKLVPRELKEQMGSSLDLEFNSNPGYGTQLLVSTESLSQSPNKGCCPAVTGCLHNGLTTSINALTVCLFSLYQCSRTCGPQMLTAFMCCGDNTIKALACLYQYTLGCLVKRIAYLINLFSGKKGYIPGLLDNNLYRRYLFIILSFVSQAASISGVSFYTAWAFHCNFEIQRCDINSHEHAIYDFFIFIVYLLIATSAVPRYSRKSLGYYNAAIHLIMHSKQTNQDQIDDLRIVYNQLISIRKDNIVKCVNFTHKAFRGILIAYLVVLTCLGLQLTYSCLSDENICDIGELYNKKWDMTFLLKIVFIVGLAFYNAWQDYLSACNYNAGIMIRTRLAEHGISCYDKDENALPIEKVLGNLKKKIGEFKKEHSLESKCSETRLEGPNEETKQSHPLYNIV